MLLPFLLLRKLNEERKMRIPYVDGQTGVAMKHYNNVRLTRERMPGRREGQVGGDCPRPPPPPPGVLLPTAQVAQEALPVPAVLHVAQTPAVLPQRPGAPASGSRGENYTDKTRKLFEDALDRNLDSATTRSVTQTCVRMCSAGCPSPDNRLENTKHGKGNNSKLSN